MTTTAETRQTDLDAINQVVATVQHAQRNELPDEFLGLFRSDAIWTTGGGRLLRGLDEISAFTHRMLPGAMKSKGLSVTMDVVHVLFIRPDVAAVKVRQRYSTIDGTPADDPRRVHRGHPDVRHGQGGRSVAPDRLPEHRGARRVLVRPTSAAAADLGRVGDPDAHRPVSALR